MTDDRRDPYRLLAAAHELGHAVAWHIAGFEVTEIRIAGHGPAAHGWVWLHHPQDSLATLDRERGYHIGLLAGREADLRWCQQAGMTFHDHTCNGDLDTLRQRRTTPLGRRISVRDARTAARRIVHTNWARITRLAPALATHGTCPPHRL